MRINNFGYLIKEGIRSVFVHGFMSFAAICVTVACLLIVGIFASVMYNVNIMVEELNQTNEILVYIDESLTDSEAESMETEIRAVDNVLYADFVSREQALQDFLEEHGNDPVFDSLEPADLRHRVVVVLEDNALMHDTVKDIEKIYGVAEITAHFELAEGFAMIQNLLEVVFVLVLGVLLAVSLLIISNTVKMAMYSRQDEIGIMKMVGATNGFIRLPFVVQGFLLGMTGAGLAFALQWWLYDLMVAKVEALDSLNMFRFVPFERLMVPMVFTFAAAGFFVGIVGSWSSIRKFLKV
ncbi:MAG: permease-like cell division protein FtsX [Oscillospiraceae bacterium]|nr:permease-like cell division protein FtsX [Oscillospiraceae bacterium]